MAACMCAALTVALCAAPVAGASEAGNVFGGAAQSSSQAAKPAGAAKPSTGAAKLTPQEKQKLTSEAQKQLQSKLGGSVKTATKTTGTETTESSSKTSTPMILALVAAALLLGGVAFVIVRDARSRAPVVEGALTGGTRNPEARLRKRRARAKAAKQQRKRNR
jgi:hypothetical protein